MKIELNFLDKEEIQMLEYHLFYILMPVSGFLINSSVKIRESKKDKISITLDYEETGRLRDQKTIPALININPDQFNQLLENNIANYFSDHPGQGSILLLALLISHELLHYLLGDFIISPHQHDFLYSQKGDTKFKHFLLNVVKDCIINDILISLFNNLYKKPWQIKVIELFKKESVDFIYICSMLDHLDRQCNYYYSNDDEKIIENLKYKLNGIIYKQQDSWKAFYLLNNFLQYLQNKVSDYFKSSHPLFLNMDIDFSVYELNNDAITSGLEDKMQYDIREKLKRLISTHYHSAYTRMISALDKNDNFSSIFSEVYKMMFNLGLIPGKEIVEDPDNVILSGYKPVPKTGYIMKNNKLQKFDYFVPKLFNPKPDNVYFYMDVSGSIYSEEISEFKSGIHKIRQTYPELNIKIYLWSNAVFETDVRLINVYSTWGTQFESVINHIKLNKFPSGSNIIIISDGCWERYDLHLPEVESYKYFFILLNNKNKQKIEKMVYTDSCRQNVKVFYQRF